MKLPSKKRVESIADWTSYLALAMVFLFWWLGDEKIINYNLSQFIALLALALALISRGISSIISKETWGGGMKATKEKNPITFMFGVSVCFIGGIVLFLKAIQDFFKLIK